MNPQTIINSSINEVLNQMPQYGFFQQLYWEGKDGAHKGVVLISGEDACRLMRDATQLLSEEPIEGPSEHEILIDKVGSAMKVMQQIEKYRNRPPEYIDADIIMACLDDVVNSHDDQVQLNESGETLAASLSSKGAKASAHVLTSLLKMIVRSGVSLREVIQYMEQRESNDNIVNKLRSALDT